MSREVRRVPKDWKHPKRPDGSYQPLFDGAGLIRRMARWDEELGQWVKGLRRDFSDDSKWVPHDRPQTLEEYVEWDGERPDPAHYMPTWSDAEATHLQMYESTSEGTPISPPMATAEELARWLADNGASAMADQTASYEAWLATIRAGGTAGSAFLDVSTGQIRSAVDAELEIAKRKGEG